MTDTCISKVMPENIVQQFCIILRGERELIFVNSLLQSNILAYSIENILPKLHFATVLVKF